jgi:hypothetical protein
MIYDPENNVTWARNANLSDTEMTWDVWDAKNSNNKSFVLQTLNGTTNETI